jgi:aquaporin Z
MTMLIRKLVAEFLGTAILVVFAVGTATLAFGFHLHGGSIAGAFALWAVFSDADGYSRATTGLGADGWGTHSMVGLQVGGAFLVEVILTFLFVLVVLLVTRHAATAGFAGMAIGAGLLVVHLIGIPLTGTSVNPARSLGPALVLGGDALKQVWLFLAAPMVGGALAAVCSRFLVPAQPLVTVGRVDSASAPPG